MKTEYKGYEITVVRDRSLSGPILKYYDIFRIKDGYHAVGGYTDDSDSVFTWMRTLKRRIDNELKEDDPWCENEDN